MFTRRTLTTGLALLLLASCGGSSSSVDADRFGPGMVIVPVPKQANAAPFLSVRLTQFWAKDGSISKVHVEFKPRAQTPRRNTVVNADPTLAARVARSFGGPLDSKAVPALAQQVLRATYCRSGPISMMGGRTRYTKPEDLQAIVDHSRKTGTDELPAGLKGEKLPPVWRDPVKANQINVDMRCDAPDPYR